MRHGSGVGGDEGGGKVEEVTVTAMSNDHTAADAEERERITAAGGTAFEVHHERQDGTVARVRNYPCLHHTYFEVSPFDPQPHR